MINLSKQAQLCSILQQQVNSAVNFRNLVLFSHVGVKGERVGQQI